MLDFSPNRTYAEQRSTRRLASLRLRKLWPFADGKPRLKVILPVLTAVTAIIVLGVMLDASASSRKHDRLVHAQELAALKSRIEDAKSAAAEAEERLARQEAQLHALTQSIDLAQQAASKDPASVNAAQGAGLSGVPPLVVAPAALRDLPYPFTNWLTIASDTDSMTLGRESEVARAIHALGLPLSDSMFLDGVEKSDPKATSVFFANHSPAQRLKFLQDYNSGYFDTLHAFQHLLFYHWHPDAPVTLDGKTHSQAVAMLGTEEGATRAAPPYKPLLAVVRYRMPLGGVLRGNLSDDKGRTVWAGDVLFAPRSTMTTAAIPLTGSNSADIAGRQLKLNLSFEARVADSAIEIGEIDLTDFNRARVAEMLAKAAEYNFRLPVFTTHNFMPIGMVGTDHWLPAPDRASWGPSFLGDNPESVAYWVDLFEAAGGEYILGGNDTSEYYRVYPISQETYPKLFNDGKWRYTFRRTFDPLMASGVDSASAEPSLGQQIVSAVGRADVSGRGTGAVIYTHWGFDNGKLKAKSDPFSPMTAQALQRLSERYYGISNGRALAESERVWVAPLYSVLAYSTVRRQIVGKVFYQRARNSIYVTPWADEVLHRQTPSSDLPLKQLAGITAYVASSSTARAFVDGVEVFGFTRNPADSSGRESITFIDDSTPTPVIDNVDIEQKNGVLKARDAQYVWRQNGGFLGGAALELGLRAADGALEWRPDTLACDRNDGFEFAVQKSSAALKVAVTLVGADGTRWQMAESAMSSSPGTIRSVLPNAADNGWHLHAVSFAGLDFQPAGRIAVPWNRIAAVVFSAHGDPGDWARFSRAGCFRNNPLRDPVGGFMVAGSIERADPSIKDVRVFLVANGKTYETTASSDGAFFFDEKIGRGTIATVYAEADGTGYKFYPLAGRQFQIENNLTDLNIRVLRLPYMIDVAERLPIVDPVGTNSGRNGDPYREQD